MKFQKKIIIIYSVFSLLVTSVIGGVYYFMSVRQYKEREYGSIKAISNVKLQQFEDQIESMRNVGTYFLSDVEVLDALWTFSELEEDTSYADIYFNEASGTIRSKIATYHFMEEFYRIIVFNQIGNVVANNNYAETTIDTGASYDTYPWIEEVSGHGGKDILIGLHEDDWGNRQKPMVISTVKEIQGANLGYIEVQIEEESLKKKINNDDEHMSYLFFRKDGELVYAEKEEQDLSFYKELLTEGNGAVEEIKTPNGESALCMRYESRSEDLILLTVACTDISRKAMAEALPISALLLLGTLALSIGYIYITSRQLTKPIHQLQKFMETTHLDNLEADIPEKISNDEIESLYISYKDVLIRLNESILKERRMSLLQLQAQFDLLQAQVNPHFIYNVLNVISNRGMISDDEVICDICSDLAGMLRYATNTQDKYATVQDEIAYLKLYLNLLKYRYEHKLSYQIQVEEEVCTQVLPKIMLQQIVENAVVHGYESSTDTIVIEVTGHQNEYGWYLNVHDNGCGIVPERLEEIRQSMEAIRRKLTKDRSHVELQIGGMGLVNTYARLYLIYNEELVFQITSEVGRGTNVRIGVQNDKSERNGK